MKVYKIGNQYYAEDIIDNEAITVSITEEVYYAYMRPIWAEAKHQERASRCRKAKGSRCMGNCSQCPEFRSGAPLSLEWLLEDGISPASSDSVDKKVLQNELYQALYTAIGCLDTRDRLIIELYFFEEKSEQQIADIVGLKQKGVNYRKNKILERLRELLKDFQ